MTKAKKDQVEKVDEVKAGGEIIVLWRATRPLSTAEHEQLSEKLRAESSLSGVRIVLAPFSVDTSVSVPEDQQIALTAREDGIDDLKEDGTVPSMPEPDVQTDKGDQ